MVVKQWQAASNHAEHLYTERFFVRSHVHSADRKIEEKSRHGSATVWRQALIELQTDSKLFRTTRTGEG